MSTPRSSTTPAKYASTANPTVTWRSAAVRTAASARTSRGWSSGWRWRNSTSASRSTSSQRAPRCTSPPASARPTTSRSSSLRERASRGGSKSERVKAAVLRAAGAQFEVTELRLRELGPRDVHVKIAASGVCHSDLSIQDGTIPHPLPAVLGHEGAGVVLEVGEQVTTVAPGDHVVLSWVAPCRRCFSCLHGHPELCEHGLDHAFAMPYATDAGGIAFLAAFG